MIGVFSRANLTSFTANGVQKEGSSNGCGKGTSYLCGNPENMTRLNNDVYQVYYLEGGLLSKETIPVCQYQHCS